MNINNHIESSSHEAARTQINSTPGAIKLGIDAHQDFHVVVMQKDGRVTLRPVAIP